MAARALPAAFGLAAPAMSSSAARRGRRLRAEARLRLRLVHDGACLADHRGGLARPSARDSPGDEVAALRVDVHALREEVRLLRALLGVAANKGKGWQENVKDAPPTPVPASPPSEDESPLPSPLLGPPPANHPDFCGPWIPLPESVPNRLSCVPYCLVDGSPILSDELTMLVMHGRPHQLAAVNSLRVGLSAGPPPLSGGLAAERFTQLHDDLVSDFDLHLAAHGR